MISNKNWVKICSFNDIIKAELAKTLLIDSGVNAVVINKNDSSFKVFGEIDIYTSSADAEKATKIILKSNL